MWRYVSNGELIASRSQGYQFLHLTRIMQLTDLTSQGALGNKFLSIIAALPSIKVITLNQLFFNLKDLELGFHFSGPIKSL